MLFESYKDWKVYPSQQKITFPKSRPGVNKPGFGNAVFLVSPNMGDSVSFIEDPNIALRECFYKYYVIDTVYKEKIGKKNIVLNETNKMKNTLKSAGMNSEDDKTPSKFPLRYIPPANRKTILDSDKSVIVDLGRWMELFFQHTIHIVSPKLRCENFINFLDKRLSDPNYTKYNKILCIDISAWVSKASDCVIMNPKLLNNPLSILIYTMYKYPALLEGKFKGIKLYLINRMSRQIFLMPSEDLVKSNYAKLKTLLKRFNGITISAEDETEPNEVSNSEIKAEMVEDFKKQVIAQMKKNLVGKVTTAELEDEITDDLDDLLDLTEDNEEIEEEEEEKEQDLSYDIDDIELDAEAMAELDAMLANNDVEGMSIDEMANALTSTMKQKLYIAKFRPERTSEQEERVKAMLNIQNLALDQVNIDNAKTKIIDTTDFSDYIESSNPNVLQSRFVNFDKNYNEKKMTQDIDNAVACLSNATNKIFVTNKKEEDTSDSMNLKKTLTYSLEDEKGNKMTLKFDVPVMIDNNYIFINGSKKLIGHQFVLKPLVKTGPDTVQLVTSYNKVFIYRDGRTDQLSNSVILYLTKNSHEYKVVNGNTLIKNKKYNVSLEFAMYCKLFSKFEIGSYKFYTEIDELLKMYKRAFPNKKVNIEKDKFPVCFNKKTGDLICLSTTDSFSNFLLSIMGPGNVDEIRKITRKPNLVYVKCKIMGKYFPLIAIMLYCEGLKSITDKAGIKYTVINKKEFRKLDKLKFDYVELQDGLLVWERTDMTVTLLMNGLKKIDLSAYTAAELESKDTYRDILVSLYGGDNSISYKIDQFYDFTIDAITKEILIDMGYPTDLMELLILATKMLCDRSYLPENNMSQMRIRSNEVISALIYKEVADAYVQYRKSAYKKKPNQVAIKQNAIIDKLLSSDTNLIEEFSTLNPVLEIEKARAVTFKGFRGIQLDRAMTLPRRGYDPSMLGIVGISTPSDALCGVNRQITLEPNITSTRGYLDVSGNEGVEDLNQANLLTATELLTPIGVIHDDPDRTAMSVKQTKYMVSVADASPVLFGNRVESTLPYLLSDEFVVDAKEDGEVVEISNEYVIVRYKSGKNYAIDISNRIRKNASAGFFVENNLTCNLKVGDKFKKGDILAYNDKAFSMNKHSKGASMNLGALTKIAITSVWDTYEDSAPITKKLAERMATDMVWECTKAVAPLTYVEKIVNIGDKVSTGDTLMVFDEVDSADFAKILADIRQDQQEEVLESTKSTVHSKYTGEVVDIKVYSTIDKEDMDPSLAKIVDDYHKRVGARNKVLDKYKNPGDLEYYKAGQIITEEDKTMKPSKNGKIKGEYADNKVVIVFYIRYRDIAAKGDKVCAQFALKGIVSHVIEEGLEPYSEYRPEEEISTIIAPLAVAARKTPSIFLAMFTNKLLIELKRQMKDMYLNS